MELQPVNVEVEDGAGLPTCPRLPFVPPTAWRARVAAPAAHGSSASTTAVVSIRPTSITLGVGTYTLGREHFPRPHPADVSKEHLRVHIPARAVREMPSTDVPSAAAASAVRSNSREETDPVTVTCLSRNAAMLQRVDPATGQVSSQRLEQNLAVPVYEGDVVYFVGMRYPFVVSVLPVEDFPGSGEAPGPIVRPSRSARPVATGDSTDEERDAVRKRARAGDEAPRPSSTYAAAAVHAPAYQVASEPARAASAAEHRRPAAPSARLSTVAFKRDICMLPLVGVGRAYGYSPPDSLSMLADAISLHLSASGPPEAYLAVVLSEDDVEAVLDNEVAITSAGSRGRAACDTATGRLLRALNKHSDLRVASSSVLPEITVELCASPASVRTIKIAFVFGKLSAPLTDEDLLAQLTTLGAACRDGRPAGSAAGCHAVCIRSNWRFVGDRWDPVCAAVMDAAGGRAFTAYAKKLHTTGSDLAAHVCPLNQPAHAETPAVRDEDITHILLSMSPSVVPGRAGELSGVSRERQLEALLTAYTNVLQSYAGLLPQAVSHQQGHAEQRGSPPIRDAEAALPLAPGAAVQAPLIMTMQAPAPAVPKAYDVATGRVGSKPREPPSPVAAATRRGKEEAARPAAEVAARDAATVGPAPVPSASRESAAEPPGPSLKDSRLIENYAGPAGWATDFRTALRLYSQHPETFPKLVMYADADCVVVPDRYPKALVHALIIPRQQPMAQATLTGEHLLGWLDGPHALRRRHCKMLRNLQEVGQRIADVIWEHVSRRVGSPSPLRVKIGLHSVPSMTPLHIHVISDDMISPCTKTTKHYRSFTTDFFLPLIDVIETLEAADSLGIVDAVAHKLLSGSVRCHRCGASFKSVPALEPHLLSCYGLDSEQVSAFYAARGFGARHDATGAAGSDDDRY